MVRGSNTGNNDSENHFYCTLAKTAINIKPYQLSWHNDLTMVKQGWHNDVTMVKQGNMYNNNNNRMTVSEHSDQNNLTALFSTPHTKTAGVAQIVVSKHTYSDHFGIFTLCVVGLIVNR